MVISRNGDSSLFKDLGDVRALKSFSKTKPGARRYNSDVILRICTVWTEVNVQPSGKLNLLHSIHHLAYDVTRVLDACKQIKTEGDCRKSPREFNLGWRRLGSNQRVDCLCGLKSRQLRFEGLDKSKEVLVEWVWIWIDIYLGPPRGNPDKESRAFNFRRILYGQI